MTEEPEQHKAIDLDLIRDILLFVDDIPSPYFSNVRMTKHDAADLDHHINILVDAGFLVRMYRLHWDGHELIDCIRDEVLWQEIKTIAGPLAGNDLNKMLVAATEIMESRVDKVLAQDSHGKA